MRPESPGCILCYVCHARDPHLRIPSVQIKKKQAQHKKSNPNYNKKKKKLTVENRMLQQCRGKLFKANASDASCNSPPFFPFSAALLGVVRLTILTSSCPMIILIWLNFDSKP